MPATLVNLDALIPREDFEETTSAPPPLAAKLPPELRLIDLVGGVTATSLRKPDFQRETAYWNFKTVAEFVQSFVEGDLIPSVILWRSPTTGNIFVIDGAHRLSALIAWVKDDYGDRTTSLAFFENLYPPEQEEAAQKTRNLIKRLVGSYEYLQSATSHPENADPSLVTRAKNADIFTIPVLWVVGNAKKAEESFYRINLKAVAIDQTELQMIRSRNKPSALAARAIIRGGVGHKYWLAFPEETQEQIRTTARQIFDILFVPPVPKSPLNTLDLPVAGRSYSGGDSLGLIFDATCLANGLIESKQRSNRGDKSKIKESDDLDGQQTLVYLKRVKRIAQRLSGKHSSSLGLHPAVYFYGITGRYQPAAFLATIALIQDLDKRNGFVKFTEQRAEFEEFLLQHRYFTNQIVSKFGGRLKSYEYLFNYYKAVLALIRDGREFGQISASLQLSDEFRYLKAKDDEEETTSSDFSTAVKTVTFVREAINRAIVCKICHARIAPRSISYDHIVPEREGGGGEPDNAQMTHPYCNSGYKEAKAAEANRPATSDS